MLYSENGQPCGTRHLPSVRQIEFNKYVFKLRAYHKAINIIYLDAKDD